MQNQPVHELVEGVWVEVESTNQNARGDVSTDTTKSNIIDNYVLQGYGVQNKSLDRLYIGNRSAGLTRAYIQFAVMPTIPAGSTITAATMTLPHPGEPGWGKVRYCESVLDRGEWNK